MKLHLSKNHYYTAEPRVGQESKYHYSYNGARAGRIMTTNWNIMDLRTVIMVPARAALHP
jgi:hypothetical protein